MNRCKQYVSCMGKETEQDINEVEETLNEMNT
jgi:hypothetical protein